ncbi:MAG: glycosyltransferase family 4 protein [Nitrospirota bacterium]|jgi:glycosyltransferase involved in cell wall biosynthesis|nr:glycosyltransferase family 4 protein [Nitrospirota bacterium]MDH4361712.1 glycosyltransferase family 4 protein [Nitrospirota bacterium]MDH5295949.1 glycosyltransferase family 4 protein [Nitrospirota bacterium]MDH5575670.1 glycosyltransferase family 4 protein [Nitrospirota bacterium]
MRVGFDAGPIRSSYSGIGQYVRCLFPAMFNRSQAIEWIAYTSSKNSAQKFLLPLHSQVSWKYPEFSWFFGLDTKEQNKPHVFHGTNFQAPNYGQKRTVLTIHDLWLARFPQYSKKLFGQTLSSWKLGRRAKRVSRVIAVSQFSAREIQDMFHLPAEHIAVIPHGCSPDMFPVREERKFQEVRVRLQLPARPFILFVGGAEPRKNHTVLFSAFSRSARLVESFSLVAVGEVESRGASLVGTARELGISDSVCCPGYVSVEDLRMLYSHAVGFVFPSLYEGFGMPLLEAMACGAPTIIGTGSALSEVGGDAVLYVNPQDPEQLGVELERLVSDQGLQEQLRTKGFERVKQFTWDRAAQQTLDLYWEVLGS